MLYRNAVAQLDFALKAARAVGLEEVLEPDGEPPPVLHSSNGE
jgi:hypothetical protein